MINIGPFPSKRSGTIGNGFWHDDWDFYAPTPGWFTVLRMKGMPRDPETGEPLCGGDTLWADTLRHFLGTPREKITRQVGYQHDRCGGTCCLAGGTVSASHGYPFHWVPQTGLTE